MVCHHEELLGTWDGSWAHGLMGSWAHGLLGSCTPVHTQVANIPRYKQKMCSVVV
jgi:hypothetical protein